ncbi:hypothetical protein [Streptomyces sp. NPDC089799]|uniref:hypothetical protein n=1 Tax=Streptomyces sp. NPDC089799 TaxID=3155066 RepID=UPI0034311A5E
MSVLTLLLPLGAVGFVCGGWVALSIRGAARSLEQYAARNAELRAHAQGRLDPPDRVASAVFFRTVGAVLSAAGAVLLLASPAIATTT